MDSIHLWIVPAVLVALKVLFDLLPKPLFFAVVAAAVGAFYVRKNMEQARNQRAAKEIEESTDSFLGELDSAEKQRKEREAKKRAAKEQQRLDKIRLQEKQKVSFSSCGMALGMSVLFCVKFFLHHI
jgi:hypothetical protein